MRRALFAASFASIVATAVVVMVIIAVTSDERAWWREMQRAQAFASSQLAAVWHDPAARDRLIHDAARTLEIRIELRDPHGDVLVQAGPPGPCRAFAVDVVHDGRTYGSVTACRPGERSPPFRALVSIAAGLLVLWLVAGLVARRATRPLLSLVDVAKRIGDGDLQARPKERHAIVEIRALSDAIGEMAARIEQQMRDQRALLAGASHELRTPLGHLRILVELLRTPDGKVNEKAVDDVEREVVEMDALVGKLLASARLDFSMAEKRDVDAADLARRALERVGEPVQKLHVASDASTREGLGVRCSGDPTLLLGALTNLLENARTHGVGVERVTVDVRRDEVAFVVDDRGPGIAPDDEERVFEPFFHKDHRATSDAARASSTSSASSAAATNAPANAAHASAGVAPSSNGTLGLGLALVKRIAAAHGGRAFATTRAEGGGRVGFTIAR